MANFDKRWGELPSKAVRDQFNFMVWALQRKDPAWGMALGRMNVRVDTKTPLMTVGMLPGGVLTLGVNFKVFGELSADASFEILKIAVQKILNGQLSSMGKRIRSTYGEIPSEMGLLMALTSATTEGARVDHKNLSLEGFYIPEAADFKLPNGKGWEWYAAKLAQQAGSEEKEEGEGQLGTPDPDWVPEDLDDVKQAKKDGKKVLPTQSSLEEHETVADRTVQGFINALQNEHDIKGRGLVAGDGVEWIDALFQPPQIEWQEKLRFMEGGEGRIIAQPTKHRLSRRGDPPGCLPMYFGRKYTGECRVLVGMDTSGSRRSSQIASINPEMRGMLYRGADIWLCQIDTQVCDIKKFSGQESEWEVFGRGGTVLQPMFDQLNQIKAKCGVDAFDFLVLATDGYTDHLDCGDTPTLILLDHDGVDPIKYQEQVTGTAVEFAVLRPPESDLNNLIGN